MSARSVLPPFLTALAGAEPEIGERFIARAVVIVAMEGAADLGTYPVAKNLRIDLGTHSAGYLNRLWLNDNVLRTNLNVNLSGMFTQLETLGGTSGLATIDGNVRVQGGDDSQFFLFGEFGEATPHVTNITGSLNVDMQD